MEVHLLEGTDPSGYVGAGPAFRKFLPPLHAPMLEVAVELGISAVARDCTAGGPRGALSRATGMLARGLGQAVCTCLPPLHAPMLDVARQGSQRMGSTGPQLCRACALAWTERFSPEAAAAGQRKMSEISGRSCERSHIFPRNGSGISRWTCRWALS